MAVKTQAQLLAEVASLLADNTTGNISALDVRTCLNDIIDSASYGGTKVYKALLTQSGNGTSTQTSGTLTIGKRYAITTFVAGDNFSNVANVVSGTINTTGCEFIATGTTPTTYTNGSTLTDTSAPVATVLVNTLSGTPVWSYDYVGGYVLTLASEFQTGKTLMYISTKNTGTQSCIIAEGDGLNTILVDTVDSTGTGINGVLSSTSITIEVYP